LRVANLPKGEAGVNAYFAALPARSRRELKKIRAAIVAIAPSATEGISYGIPTFKLDGRVLVYYAGWKEHASLYPMTASIQRAFAAELAGYETSKGTIRFPLDNPVPIAFVKRLVKARVAELKEKYKR
jgi:uncharacterized protein YdhG (YjbR/CyaY superfamily)